MANWQQLITEIEPSILALQSQLKKLMSQRRQWKKNLNWEIKYKKTRKK
jgi:hypothetical protein